MKTKTLFISVLLFFYIGYSITGQAPPTVDENWQLQTNLSDEFNTEKINTEKWHVFQKKQYPYGQGHCWKPENVFLDSGDLKLKVTSKPFEDPECYSEKLNIGPWVASYYSGGIESQNNIYSYGYYEIKAKLPGYYNFGVPCGQGFWPAFWTYYVEYYEDCRIIHDEIDILEPSGNQYSDGMSNVAGWWDEIGECNQWKPSGDLWYTHDEPLFEDYHKYAIEWLLGRITFFFDDVPFFTKNDNDPTLVVFNDQFVVIDQQIDRNSLPNPNTPLPQYMSVNYFRYYEMLMDCSTNAVITNNSEFNSFDFAVKKSISIGGSFPITMNNDDAKTFRAIDYILIDGIFTVPLGSELNLINTLNNEI